MSSRQMSVYLVLEFPLMEECTISGVNPTSHVMHLVDPLKPNTSQTNLFKSEIVILAPPPSSLTSNPSPSYSEGNCKYLMNVFTSLCVYFPMCQKLGPRHHNLSCILI